MQNTSLRKIEDIDGCNYIVWSRLNRYEQVLTTDKFSIKSVKQGLERYTVSRKELPVREDNFMIVNPGQEVEVIIDSKSDVLGCCYFFDPRLVQQIQFSATQTVEQNLDNISPNHDLTFHNTPIHAYQTFLSPHLLEAPPCEEWDKYQVSEYLILLAEKMVVHQQDMRTKLMRLEGTKLATQEELYKRIQRGRQYIHDRFQEAISLKDIARNACLSEYYFHRNFHHFFGLTPYQYLLDVRMNQAQRLFASDLWSRSEVASLCGYSDTKYFSKSYKKWRQARA